jgi:hypothetical protein
MLGGLIKSTERRRDYRVLAPDGLATEDRPEISAICEILASARAEEGFVGTFAEVAVAASTGEFPPGPDGSLHGGPLTGSCS